MSMENNQGEYTEKEIDSVNEEICKESPSAAEECTYSQLTREDLESKLMQSEKQCSENIDRLQRTMAEFDNFRKRTTKEKSSMYEDGIRDTVQKILPVIDNLERALGTAEMNTTEEKSFFQGIQMVLRQCKDILGGLGVEEILSVGQQFDPLIHYAVSHIEDDNFGSNEIVEEMQKGYTCKDKVIRHSMVKVAN